ncbi:MAG: hypothetical protein U5N10_05630 [Gemmobacter sp.]|nr:hypothetical protein [Gemmobacter sp.]
MRHSHGRPNTRQTGPWRCAAGCSQIVDQRLTDRATIPLRRLIRHRLAARSHYAVRAWRIDAKDEDARGP